jgi:FkbM family methyltransferase
MTNGHASLSTRVRRAALVVALMALSASAALLVTRRQFAELLAPHARANVTDAQELAALAAKYGPDRNSQNSEEWILRDFFGDQRDGVFVDVGANHYRNFSNTYYLETALGWSGVAIEPQVKFAEGYRKYRPRTTFVPLFVSDVSNQSATLYVTENDLVASSNRRFTEAFGGEAVPTPVTTTTLDDVLKRLGVDRVDFLSIDIELAEPQALAGFSLERFKPRLVAVEAHPPIRQQLLDHFARHQYVLVGRYWRVDSENFWFAPVGAVSDGEPLVPGEVH